MKTKLPLVLTLTAMTVALATNAGAGHRTFPKEQTDALMEPVKSVFDYYLKIESALANESGVGIGFNASAIASAIRGDSMKMFPKKVANQAEILAGTRNLSSAREAFKPLSKSLIQYLADHNITSAYVEVYCPMAKASWLQKDKKIKNPYLGGSMRSCGAIRPKPGASRDSDC
ncbi:MAG TPA: DUF3347 domain-containing protein [Candidatus Udaeobacter sp.]|nr:DUF3347 domain-containing protein [Candidatus Udaeobacter sp.]